MGVKIREKEKGSGVWWLFINYKGKRASRQIGTEKAAEKAMEHAQARLKLGLAFLPQEEKPAPTVSDYYERFKKVYLGTVREGTRSRYETSFKHHVIPFLGSTRLNQLTARRYVTSSDTSWRRNFHSRSKKRAETKTAKLSSS